MTPLPNNSRADRLRKTTIGLALSAAGVALYLGIVSLQLRGTPWGCGAGSGCADVLKSRWSNVAGIPVGFFAAATYAAIAILAWSARTSAHARARNILTILAAAVMSTAIYFVFLQLAIIKAICPWCMVDHSLGVATAVAALALARTQSPRNVVIAKTSSAGDPLSDYDLEGAPKTIPAATRRPSAFGSIMAGVVLSLGFVALQHFTARTPDVARITSAIEPSAGGTGLKLSLKNGSVTLPINALPAIGSADAPRKLVLMFDYCCPHCREAHAVIRQLHATAGQQWQLVFVPVPLNSSCNPAIEETEERFRDACDLARLSLAVWKLKPGDWAVFDDWLFDPEQPRSAQEARDHAAALYGEIELAEALIDPVLDTAIKADVAAYQATGSRVLPIILSPGSAGIAGRTETSDELKELLSREFGYPIPR